MAKDSKLIYLDSCVVLDSLIKDPDFYNHVEPIIKDAEAGNLKIVLSVLARAEIIKVKTSEKEKTTLSDEDATALIESFFRQEFVTVHAVNARTATEAGKLRKRFPLDTPDAIHLATAIEAKAQAFITRDGDNKGKRKKTKILSCKKQLANQIVILTPKEFFDSLSSEIKQTELPPHDEAEKDKEE